jgi:hypothetical protein
MEKCHNKKVTLAKSEDPDFLIVLDANYSKLARLGLRTLMYFHPESKVFIYDLSPHPSKELQLLSESYENVNYIFWPYSQWLKNDWVDTIDFSYFNQTITDHLKYYFRVLRHRMFGQYKEGWILDKKEFVSHKKNVINIWMQKAVCCQDCLQRTSSHLVFLDADAFVWRQLGSIFLKEFDIALTLRRLDDIKIGTDPAVKCNNPIPYLAINAGVLFLKNNNYSRRFIEQWIKKILTTRYFLIDQTALSLLVLEANKNAFKRYEKNIKIKCEEMNVIVKLLPCEFYNNIYIRDDFTFDSDIVYIAHFKGYLHKEKYYSSLEAIVEKHLSLG